MVFCRTKPTSLVIINTVKSHAILLGNDLPQGVGETPNTHGSPILFSGPSVSETVPVQGASQLPIGVGEKAGALALSTPSATCCRRDAWAEIAKRSQEVVCFQRVVGGRADPPSTPRFALASVEQT